MRRLLLPALLLCLLAIPASSSMAHPERTTNFPVFKDGMKPPELRTSGPALIVCKPESRALINKIFRGKGKLLPGRKRERLRLLKKCKFEHIQQAVDAASSGSRIMVMPGTYREEPSRKVPHNDDKCSGGGYWEPTNDGHGQDGRVPTYKFQKDCPLSRNLIAIIGDTNDDGRCDAKCDLQIEGMGRYARNVLIEGDRIKEDVIRADRADGIVITNVTVEEAAFNNIDVVETLGFHLEKVVARYGQNYGVLTFTSDNGLYRNIEAYGNGDSGIYPGSGPEGGCKRFGIEIDNVRSFGNVLGYSGTAGNGTYVHDSKFYDNAAGISDDSFASGHPGMPQDCSKWENNRIYSNNVNIFDDENEKYCNAREFKDRLDRIVCPQFQVPVGSGIILYGANKNIIKGNYIYDNHRSGIRLFYVPASIRGEMDPTKQYDTSNGNQFVDNFMGMRPDGTRDPNGKDFFWDEEGQGNCWSRNMGPGGAPVTSDPAMLPTCESGGSLFTPGNAAKLAKEVPCATWNKRTNPDPAGCDWFMSQPEPK